MGSGAANRRWDRRQGGRRLKNVSRSDTCRSYDTRNCVQWFARFEERTERPTGRPSRSEVRRLHKELEALRRLVTGVQIP
jgi:hypothetical protein